MTQALTLGVIGHVDHGKTALVRALTGIETDRLKEERERGLSIVLGFASLETPFGVMDLIDVPGHEEFIRAMVSGATGLDGAVLVVAANEGIMPQTREHFAIARLLQVDRGLVVLSKADLVSDQTLRVVNDEIRALVRGSFLEGAPVVAVSASSGAGLEALRQALAELAAAPVRRPAGRGFFLPLDRVFTIHGFGVIATGTLRGGPLRVDDRVEIMPSGLTATVRALQSRNQPIDEAVPGQRVAVNLRNIDREHLERGDTLAKPGLLTATRRLDVEVELLANDVPSQWASLKNDATVRLLIGTTEAIAKVRLLDCDTLAPGSVGLAQLHTDRDIATDASERFVIRTYSPMTTIGGGKILDANPQRHKRFDAAVTRRLATLGTDDLTSTLTMQVLEAGVRGVGVEQIAQYHDLPREAVQARAADAAALVIAGRLVAHKTFVELLERLFGAVAQYHRDNLHHRGIAVGRLKSMLPPELHDEIFRCALSEVVASGKLRNDGDMLSLTDFDPLADLDQRSRDVCAAIEKQFRDGGLSPPPLETVVSRDKQSASLYRMLLETGQLIKLRTYDRDTELVLHKATIEGAKGRIRERYPHPETFALKDVRDLLGTTRRYLLPLMEHFDSTGVTIRVGDLRRVRER